MKQAIILDLDNTIYPVSSIADHLFEKIFALLDKNAGEINYEDLAAAKDDLTRRHFHLVADKFNFSPELKAQGINLLSHMEYDLPMHPFEDYRHIQAANIQKFLVTTGFTKLQWSKIKMMGIKDDFAEIHIVDPEKSNQTKKDVFADILKRYNYTAKNVLVIGDDPESEIKAAMELGIETFLFDPEGKHAGAVVTYRAIDLRDALNHLS
jgi:putative hydrolase of the HAD superfamily